MTARRKPKSDIADIKRFKLGPEDVLVVKIDGVLSVEMASRVQSCFANAVPELAGRILVIDGLVELAVLDKSQAGPLRPLTRKRFPPPSTFPSVSTSTPPL